MTIIEALILLRNDLRSWVAYNLQHKIDKEEGKGLSTNDYTDADKNKLDGIAENAEVNVQSDWAIQDESSDAFIKNKPTIPTVPDYLPNQYSLKFGDKSYNGSSEQAITAADLGLSQALKYHGVSETALTDGSTTNPITILGESHTAESGCVVFYNNKEFVWNGSVWEELGDLSGVDLTGYATEQWVEDKKYLTLETDPVFNASPAKGITNDDIKNWNGKTSNVGTITGITMNGVSKGTTGVVDLGTVITQHLSLEDYVKKEEGKGLSSNDYTDTEKTKLGNLVSNVLSDWSAVSGNAVILNKPTLATVATTGSYTDLSNTPSIPTKTSDLTNDSNFITGVSWNDVTGKPAIPETYAPVDAEKNVLANWNETDSTSDAYIQNKPAIPTSYAPTDAQKNVLSDWNEASTGSDAYIKNKPKFKTINGLNLIGEGDIKIVTESGGLTSESDPLFTASPAAGITDDHIEDWTKKYTKPTGGIPKSDLSSDVQTSLGKADTALQSYTEQYTGTYSKPDGGIPKTDLDVNVQTSLSKADSALQEETYKGTVTEIIAGTGLTGGTITGSGTIAVDTSTYKLPTHTEWGVATGVTDVQVNGTSVVANKVANITISSSDTKCTSLTLSQGAATTPSGDTVEVIENKNITASGTGTSLSGTLTAVTVPTKEYTDKTFATLSLVNDYTQVIAGSLVDLNNRVSYNVLDIDRRYLKPNTGIPLTDLSALILTSLSNADTAFGWGDHNNKYLSSEGGIVTGNITALSFSISSGSNDYVLLAGGGTKPLSELGGITSEIDPIFKASPANDVTTTHINLLNELEGGKITINNDDHMLQLVNAEGKYIATFNKAGFTWVNYLSAENIELVSEYDAGWAENCITPSSIELYESAVIDDTSPDANEFHTTITPRNITLSQSLIKDDISLETTVAPSGITTPRVLLPEGALELLNGAAYCENSEINITGGTINISQGPITVYGDTQLKFEAETSTTTIGPTEHGFSISNDGELKLTGDSIVVNSADSIYFSTSSDATFDSQVYVTNEVHAQAFYETSDARKKDIKSELSLDKCYDLIDKCQTVIYSLKDQTKEQVGMIAQEIEEFFPEVVATDDEGFKSLAYDRLVVICFKVLKDVIKRLNYIENNL